MKEVLIDKVVVNVGVGAEPDKMKRAIEVIKQLTGKKPTKTQGKGRIPDWGVRPGLDLGIKVTLRKKEAEEFLKKVLPAKDNKISAKSFDKEGNFAFGIREHIDIPGVKYDPKLGIIGFDVLVGLKKRGYRIKYRKIEKRKVGEKQRVSKEEAMEFAKSLGVEIQ